MTGRREWFTLNRGGFCEEVMTSSEVELRPGGLDRTIPLPLQGKEIPGRRLSRCKATKMKMVLECVRSGGKADMSGTERSVGKVGKC